MVTRIDLDSVAPYLAPITTAIEVVATRTPIEVTPDHSPDLAITVSHIIGALVPTATAVTHLSADLLGNIRIRDTSKSPLMTHCQSTTAQTTMTVTQRMI